MPSIKAVDLFFDKGPGSTVSLYRLLSLVHFFIALVSYDDSRVVDSSDIKHVAQLQNCITEVVVTLSNYY